jgi:hypothetical protein
MHEIGDFRYCCTVRLNSKSSASANSATSSTQSLRVLFSIDAGIFGD